MRRLDRHPLDLVSLIAGLVFVAVAVAHLVGQVTDTRLDGRWIAPLVLVGLGVAGLAGTLRGRSPEDGEVDGS